MNQIYSLRKYVPFEIRFVLSNVSPFVDVIRNRRSSPESTLVILCHSILILTDGVHTTTYNIFQRSSAVIQPDDYEVNEKLVSTTVI